MNLRLTNLIALSLMVAFAGMGKEHADTVKVIDNARNVNVIREGNKTSVNAEYRDEDGFPLTYRYEVEVGDAGDTDSDFSDNWGMDLPFMKPTCPDCDRADSDGKVRTRRFVTAMRHMYWGWRFNYGDKAGVKNCFELGVRDVLGLMWRRRGAEFEIGFGMGMRRFLAQDGLCFRKEGDAVRLSPADPDVELRHSRLDVFTFHIPVLYNQTICDELRFSVGGVVNLNTYARIFDETAADGVQLKRHYKGLQQRLLTADAVASLTVGGFGMYASWSPVALFESKYGPGMKAWSIGVELDF